LAAAVLWAFFAEIVRYRAPGHSIVGVALTSLAALYIGLTQSFVIQLRVLDDAPGNGLAAFAALIGCVKLCDVGAYTFGRLFGRHKMSPRVSPGKTVEGAIGGIALAVVFAVAVFAWGLPAITGRPAAVSVWRWMVFGAAIAVAGILGDLAESLLKRDAGRKDSSAWMPGFGGVLDIMDSILLAAPVAYLLWAARFVAW
jgi:phosphatidate cytidylyltransferase